jgi:hypothetical protein
MYCLFVFQYYFSVMFSGTKGYFSSSLGCAMSHATLDSSPFPQVSSFHDIYTLGTMCNLSLRVCETQLHTLCLIFEKKEKKACS